MIESRGVSGFELDESIKQLFSSSKVSSHAFVAGGAARACYLGTLGYEEEITEYVLYPKDKDIKTIRAIANGLADVECYIASTRRDIPGKLYYTIGGKSLTLLEVLGTGPVYIADILRGLPPAYQFALSKEKLQFRVWWDDKAGREAEEQAKIKLLTGTKICDKIESHSNKEEGDGDE